MASNARRTRAPSTWKPRASCHSVSMVMRPWACSTVCFHHQHTKQQMHALRTWLMSSAGTAASHADTSAASTAPATSTHAAVRCHHALSQHVTFKPVARRCGVCSMHASLSYIWLSSCVASTSTLKQRQTLSPSAAHVLAGQYVVQGQALERGVAVVHHQGAALQHDVIGTWHA